MGTPRSRFGSATKGDPSQIHHRPPLSKTWLRIRTFGCECQFLCQSRARSKQLKGSVAQHGDPLHFAYCRPIVGCRKVLRAAVIPKRDGMFLPLEPALDVRIRCGAIKRLKQWCRFLRENSLKGSGKGAVHINGFLARYGMSPKHWMGGRRESASQRSNVFSESATRVHTAQKHFIIMYGASRMELCFCCIIKLVVSGFHISE